jgi:hypothetical protein
MSILHWGDEDLHYSDNSHRWIAPPGIEPGTWEAGVRAHLAQHLTTMGGPVKVDEVRKSRAPRPRPPRPPAKQIVTHRSGAGIGVR